MPTRAPPARIDATSSASRPVRRTPRRPRKPAPPSGTVQHPSLARPLDVLAYLQHDAERLIEVGVLEREQGLCPCDRLAHAGQLVELLAAQPGHRAADPLGDLVRHAWQARADYLRLALRARVVDPVVEAASLERIVQLARAVRGHNHERAPLRRDGPQLRNRDLEVGEELEQKRLELVVGAIDLVDQQDDRLTRLESLEQWAAQQKALGVQGL